MRIKINLTKPNTKVPVNNQHQMNGFIFSSFGKDSKYHDSFSDYCISSLQGGKLNEDKKTLNFNSCIPHFYISGNNEFIGMAIDAFTNSTASFFGMKFHSIDVFDDFKVSESFDNVVTISPILLKNKDGRKITVNDENFIELLTEHCIKKLSHFGINDKTFKIEIINKNKSKAKCVWVGDIFNPCSMVRLKVFGKKNTRKMLYNVGLGCSTGSGFGNVKIYSI